MRWVILTYLILNPLFFLVNFDQRDAQQLFFQLSSVLVFCIGMFFRQKEVKLSKLNIAIGVMMIAFLVAWLRSFNALPAEFAPRWYIAMNFLFGLLVYNTVIRTIKRDDIPFILKGLGIFTAFCVIVLALQYIGYDFRGTVIWRGVPYAPEESIFFQRSAMGMYFANNLPLLLTFSPIMLLLFFPIALSQSTGALLGVVCATLFFFWFRKRIYFWVALGLLIVAIPIMLLIPKIRNEALTGLKIRLPLWGAVIQDISKNPLGYGLDSFYNPISNEHWRYFNYYDLHGNDNKCIKAVKTDKGVKGFTDTDTEYFHKAIDAKGTVEKCDHPHNEYIWLGYEVGVQALIVLGFIFYFIWERFRLSKREPITCALTGVLICLVIESFFQFPFHLARVGHILPIAMGLFYITTEEE